MEWISSKWGESASGRRVRIYVLTRADLVRSRLKTIEAHGRVHVMAVCRETARLHQLPEAVGGLRLGLVEI